MSVYRNSRYRGVKYTSVNFQDGSRKVFLHSRKHLTVDDISTPLKLRYVREHDSMDMLAKTLGADERRWWILADINEVLFPLEITERELYVPQKKEFNKFG